MTVVFAESIWDKVRLHPWKYRVRNTRPNAIIWHITGSGTSNTSQQEYNGTKNWFISPNNVVHDARYGDYGGVSNVMVGPGGVCEVVPMDDYQPRFSTYSSDEHAVSVEVALPTVTAPLDPQTMAHCVTLGRALREKYGIPHTRVWPKRDYPNDLVWVGEAGHADTWQNQHSDPGERWWAEYLRLTAQEEDLDNDLKTVLFADYKLIVTAGNIGAARSVLGECTVGQEFRLDADQGYAFAKAQGMRLFEGLRLAQGGS